MPDKIFFYIDPIDITDDCFRLNNQESFHYTTVLRKQIGTEVWLTNGIGIAYNAIVQNIQNNIVSGRIIKELPNYGENRTQIQLGIGILKKDKMETVVEKATELGVNHIVPLLLDRSIKRSINVERLKKIAFTATKQCGRSIIPILHEPIRIDEFLTSIDDNVLLVCHDSSNKEISKLKSLIKNDLKVTVLIGSEGDFSQNEINQFNDNNAEFINLGKRRLRSETAVIVALSQINLYCN